MSQRTVVEINHDVPGTVPGDQGRLYEMLMRAVASGSPESWEPLRRYGFTRITQCHHSEDRKVVVGSGMLVREYPFG